MLGTSTLIRPNQVFIEILIYNDATNRATVPAYFNVSTNALMLNRKLIALESYADADVPFSPLSPGIPTIDSTVWTNATLTLLREPGNGVPGGDFYKNIPLLSMHRLLDSRMLGGIHYPTAPDLWRCEPTEVSWSDSFINFTTPINLGVPIASVPFVATFLLPEQDPEPYRLVHLKR